jgi:hypothetical protein
MVKLVARAVASVEPAHSESRTCQLSCRDGHLKENRNCPSTRDAPMNETLENLVVILNSVVERLIHGGEEPEHIVAQVLRNAQSVCIRDLRELTQECISNMDEITSASTNRTDDEVSWLSAVKSEDVDFDSYYRETSAHSDSINELQQHGEKKQKAMLLSRAAYRAHQIENILRDVKPIEIAPEAAVRTVIDMANAGHLPEEDELYNNRLQRVLRYLIERGSLSSADSCTTRAPRFWEDDMPSLDEIWYGYIERIGDEGEIPSLDEISYGDIECAVVTGNIL